MNTAPVKRCCPSHSDWPTLTAHLVVDFCELADGEVLKELDVAREALEAMHLTEDADALLLAELVARYRLMLRMGQVTTVARLDPERHRGRSTPAPAGSPASGVQIVEPLPGHTSAPE